MSRTPNGPTIVGLDANGNRIPVLVDADGAIVSSSDGGGSTVTLVSAPRSSPVITLNNKNATGSDASLDVSGCGTALINVSANAGSTIVFEGSVDGSTYITILGHQRGAGTYSSTTSGTGVWVFDVRGFSLLRARISVAAGAVTATAYGTAAPGTENLIDVDGNIGSGATDVGNPVKGGSKYNAANVTVTDGQRVDDQATVNGFKRTDLGTLLAGEDLTYNRMRNLPAYNYTPITTQTTTVVKGTPGILGAIIINKPVASGVIKIDDAASDTTPILGTITNPGTLVSEGPIVAWYNAIMTVGITIVTSGATQDITVLWL